MKTLIERHERKIWGTVVVALVAALVAVFGLDLTREILDTATPLIESPTPE